MGKFDYMSLLRFLARSLFASAFVADGVRKVTSPAELAPEAEAFTSRVTPFVQRVVPSSYSSHVPDRAESWVRICGAVEVVPLGLPAPTSRPIARRPVDGALGDYLTRVVPEPGANDHKYTRGVVGLWAGSETYPGAAVLAASGAVLAGAGMVRLTAPRRVEDLVLAARPEVVPAAGRPATTAGVTAPRQRVDATVAGAPGNNREGTKEIPE